MTAPNFAQMLHRLTEEWENGPEDIEPFNTFLVRSAYAAGAAAEREGLTAVVQERTFHEAAEYTRGYAQAVMRAGNTDAANTLMAVAQSLDEAAARARSAAEKGEVPR